MGCVSLCAFNDFRINRLDPPLRLPEIAKQLFSVDHDQKLVLINLCRPPISCRPRLAKLDDRRCMLLVGVMKNGQWLRQRPVQALHEFLFTEGQWVTAPCPISTHRYIPAFSYSLGNFGIDFDLHACEKRQPRLRFHPTMRWAH